MPIIHGKSRLSPNRRTGGKTALPYTIEYPLDTRHIVDCVGRSSGHVQRSAVRPRESETKPQCLNDALAETEFERIGVHALYRQLVYFGPKTSDLHLLILDSTNNQIRIFLDFPRSDLMISLSWYLSFPHSKKR